MDEQLINVGKSTKLWAQANEIPCQFLEECKSTSDWAKEAYQIHHELEIFISNHQTHGRGRGNNEWIDNNKGKNLLSTWCFQVSQPPQPITSPLIGLAVYGAARTTWPSLDWSLKAPNDLYLGDKKAAGILLESVSRGSMHQVFIGFGMNVLAQPENIPHSTFLTSELGTGNDISTFKWDEFLSQLIGHFNHALNMCTKSLLSEEAREGLVRALNRNPIRPGLILEISPEGDLVLEKETIPWQTL
ncbi:MAG: hypothetical protein KDD34_07835 [Bdellovibrionales bacterium]|nr:hypothetical protein [Bdellovibrionales bacterium]